MISPLISYTVAIGCVRLGRVELLPSSLDRETARLQALLPPLESPHMHNASPRPSAKIGVMLGHESRRHIQGVASAAVAFSIGQARFLEGHTDVVSSVAFSPITPTMLASGSADYTVALWDIGSMTRIAVLKGHTGSVTSVAFSRQVCSQNEHQTVLSASRELMSLFKSCFIA